MKPPQFEMGNGGAAKSQRQTRAIDTPQVKQHLSPKAYHGAHFATFPPDLIKPCIFAGAPVAGVVLDPFLGSGTTAMVAKKLGRSYVGIELNPKYLKLAHERIDGAYYQPQLIAAE